MPVYHDHRWDQLHIIFEDPGKVNDNLKVSQINQIFCFTGSEWDGWVPHEILNVQKVELSVLMRNVRGINAVNKQQYLDLLIREQRPEIMIFNETKLISPLYLDGYVSHQTLFKRSGGWITISNLKVHKKVKALGTFLNWSKVLLGCEEVHILNVYLEPCHEKFVVQRADKVIQLVKDIVR
jgi:hypothetical protein